MNEIRETGAMGPQIVLGTMYFGTRTAEDDAHTLIDTFVELGGRWLDTADCYCFWEGERGVGGASEEVLGRWLGQGPGRRERVSISTKVRWQPLVPHRWPESAEGLSATAVRHGVDGSLKRLGTDAVDLLWAHGEDREVPLDESVGALGQEVVRGRAARLGASNHRAWSVERARALATARGLPGFEALQLRHSYLAPRPGVTLDDGHMLATDDHLDLAADARLPLWVYTPLLNGSYVREDRPLPEGYRHPGTDSRRAALAAVAAECEATPNQVVLAWLMSATVPASPIVGVSSVPQLREAMAARDLVLTRAQRSRLDEAH